MSEELKAKDDEILELFKMCNEKDKEIERLNNKVEEERTLYTTEREVKEEYKDKINKAIEELEQAYTNIDNNKNVNYIHIALKQDLLKILKGEE